MSVLRRIFAVAAVETLRLTRLRTAFTLLLLVPAMQVVLFGYAIRPTAATVSVVIAASRTDDAAGVRAVLARDPALAITATTLKPGEAERQVRAGAALAGIEIPANGAAPGVFVDAVDPALTAAATARIETAYWRAVAQQAGVPVAGASPRVERLYNPAGRADWAFLPALIGVTTMISMIMLGTLSLAREREGGTWEALMVLPVTPIEALIGKLTPYGVVGTVQGILVLTVGIAVFDVPAHGSVVALVALVPLFAAAHLALGYAIAARAATQLSALQGTVAFYLPAMLLSGFLYPFATLPPWAQTAGNLFPLTHFIRAAREATLRGSGPGVVLAHGLPIGAFLIVAITVAMADRTRRLD